jgi:hypothetical protein
MTKEFYYYKTIFFLVLNLLDIIKTEQTQKTVSVAN